MNGTDPNSNHKDDNVHMESTEEQGQKVSDSSAQFGTMTSFPDRIPPQVLSTPFERADSLVYLYCTNCGAIDELNSDALEGAIEIVNIIEGGNRWTLEGFEPNRYWVKADGGCTRCKPEPDEVIVLSFEEKE